MFYRLEPAHPGETSPSAMMGALAAMSAMVNRIFEDDEHPPQLGKCETLGIMVFMEIFGNTLDHLSDQVEKMEKELGQRRLAEIKADLGIPQSDGQESAPAPSRQEVMARLTDMVDAHVGRVAGEQQAEAPAPIQAPILTEPVAGADAGGKPIKEPLRGRKAG